MFSNGQYFKVALPQKNFSSFCMTSLFQGGEGFKEGAKFDAFADTVNSTCTKKAYTCYIYRPYLSGGHACFLSCSISSM